MIETVALFELSGVSRHYFGPVGISVGNAD
jgi:hypothetical protein